MATSDLAVEKLDGELKHGKFDRYGDVMKKAVRDALAEFCRQDAGFAQDVLQGGSFEECMKAVSKNVHSVLSDLEAYKRAAKYYRPGAEVRFEMRLTGGGRRADNIRPYDEGQRNDKGVAPCDGGRAEDVRPCGDVETAAGPVIFDLTAFL